MRSYEAARSLFSFLAFLAWSVVVIGGLVAIVSAVGVSQYSRYTGGGSAALLAMLPGAGIAVAGFILIAFVQMGRATVDTAEYTQQMLKIARDQLEVSKQGLKAQSAAPQSFTATTKKESPSSPKASFASQTEKSSKSNAAPKEPQQIEEPGTGIPYKDKKIKLDNGNFIYNGISFATLDAAKQYIDKFSFSASKSLSATPEET